MWKKFCDLLKKYREQISYLIFGGLTTLISWGTFTLFFYLVFGQNESYNLVSNIISESIAITFAYVTNKLFVFRSKTNTAKAFFKEMLSFYGLRILSSLFNFGAMILFINVLHLGLAWLWKIITNIVVIILNYIFSKLFIFNRNKKANEKDYSKIKQDENNHMTSGQGGEENE